MLLATTDIYREAGDGHFAKRENAETQFDLKLAWIREKIIGSCVKTVSLSNCGDIAMALLAKSGDMLQLQALCDCSCEDEELWRVFPMIKMRRMWCVIQTGAEKNTAMTTGGQRCFWYLPALQFLRFLKSGDFSFLKRLLRKQEQPP